MGLLDEAGGDFYRFNCFDLEVGRIGHRIFEGDFKAVKIGDTFNIEIGDISIFVISKLNKFPRFFTKEKIVRGFEVKNASNNSISWETNVINCNIQRYPTSRM